LARPKTKGSLGKMVLNLKGKRPIQKTNGNSKKNKKITKQIKRVRKNWTFTETQRETNSENDICSRSEKVYLHRDCKKKFCNVYETYLSRSEVKKKLLEINQNIKITGKKVKSFCEKINKLSRIKNKLQKKLRCLERQKEDINYKG
jgi:hypothetical protein